LARADRCPYPRKIRPIAPLTNLFSHEICSLTPFREASWVTFMLPGHLMAVQQVQLVGFSGRGLFRRIPPLQLVFCLFPMGLRKASRLRPHGYISFFQKGYVAQLPPVIERNRPPFALSIFSPRKAPPESPEKGLFRRRLSPSCRSTPLQTAHLLRVERRADRQRASILCRKAFSPNAFASLA